MTDTELIQAIKSISESFRIDGNVLEFEHEGVSMACIFDMAADRMRIIAPITELEQLTDDAFRVLLEANFHSALDARYAISDGIVFSAFLHPLSSLTTELALAAVSQVTNLVTTFGTTFSSTDLVYGQPFDPQDLN